MSLTPPLLLSSALESILSSRIPLATNRHHQQTSIMALITERRTTSAESPSMDWLDALISTVGVVSTLTEAPLPWVSAATEVVLTLLKRIKSSLQNAEDLKVLACSIVDFVVLLRDSTIRHTEISLDSSHDNPFKQTCIEFTNTLTTILNDLNTMKNRDKNWLKKYLKAESIARKIDKYKEALGHVQNQLTTRAAVETGFYLPLIKDDLSSHRAESREHFQELKSHIVGNNYRGQFTILKRGDLRLIRQQAVHSEYVVEIQTTGVVPTQKSTKRQRRHRSFYGETCAKYSVDYIDWVADVCKEGDERVVRQYQGPYSKARFENDLELYQKAMHPNIAQVFAVLPDVHSIVFYDNATVPFGEYLANMPSPVDRFIAECRIAEEILSLEEYCKTNPYYVTISRETIPMSRYTEHVSLTFGRNGGITVADNNCAWRGFRVSGFSAHQNHRIPSIEISNIFNKKRSTHVRPLSLLPMLYAAMEVVEDSAWRCVQSIQLAAKPYKTSILGFGCVCRSIPDGFEKIAQLHLCHGQDTYSRQRIRFRWKAHRRQWYRLRSWVRKEVSSSRTLTGNIFPVQEPPPRVDIIKGWTRCEVSSPRTLTLSAHPVRKLKPRADIILSQIHRLALLSGVRETDLTCVERISFELKFRPMQPRANTLELVGLAGTFMAENDDLMNGGKQQKAFIFIRDVEVDISDDTSVLTVPEMYWSSDPRGIVRWTEEELNEYLATWDLQTDNLILEAQHYSYTWTKEHFDVLREAHRLYGFNPDSDEIAKALGYPILEVNPTLFPKDILAPHPDSEQDDEVHPTNFGSNVDNRADPPI